VSSQAATSLRALPEPFRSFYARRAARLLLELFEGGGGGGEGGGGADCGAGAVGAEGAEGAEGAVGAEVAAGDGGGGGIGAGAGGGGGAEPRQLPGGPRAALRPTPPFGIPCTAPPPGIPTPEPTSPPVISAPPSGIPMLGLGTWGLPRSETAAAVSAALAAGVRHFDCAPVYANEDEARSHETVCCPRSCNSSIL
jgi:hypothetical protein